MCPSSCSPIQIRCPLCPNEHPVESPEELCGHMAQCHEMQTTMQSKCFESFAHFQIWLSHIEDSRSDGGYLGSSQGPTYEDVSALLLCFLPSPPSLQEYYLLCRRRPSAPIKKRRLSIDMCNLETSAVVACTAFVHVFETMDGRVTVRYCLDHCGHAFEGDEQKNTDTTKFRKRSTLKRTSPCATFEMCDESCDCEVSGILNHVAVNIPKTSFDITAL